MGGKDGKYASIGSSVIYQVASNESISLKRSLDAHIIVRKKAPIK